MSPRALHRWHRRAGAAAAAALIYLALTGVPLQYSSQLQLGSRHVSWSPVLDWYGLEAPRTVLRSFEITAVGEELYMADQHLLTLSGFVGAASVPGLLAVAGRDETVLLSADSYEIIDRWSVGTPISAIGTWQQRVVLRTADGLRMSDEQLVNWSTAPASEDGIVWANLETLDAEAADPFREAFRGRMLTVERFLQDLHSGRCFGRVGILVVDAAAALLIFLAASGLLMWARYSTSSSRR